MVANNNYNNYMVSENSNDVAIVHNAGILYSAMATMVDGSHMLIICPEFYSLKEYTREFVKCHEEGHMLRGEAEEDADGYAVEVLGKKQCLKALKNIMWDMIKNHRAQIGGVLEIYNRYYYIKTGGRKLFIISRDIHY